MGSAAEVHDRGGTFELPDVPDFVLSDVAFFVEGEVEVIEAVFVDELHGFGNVFFAVGGEDIPDDLADVGFLIGGEAGDLDTIETFLFAGELDGVAALFAAAEIVEGLFALLLVEHFVDFVGADCLIPVSVAFVVGPLVEGVGSVAVEERASESGACDGVTVATAGAVTAGKNEFEFAGVGLAEEGDGGILEALFAGVVNDLLVNFLGVFRAVQAHEDVLDHGLLVLVEVVQAGLGDVPVVIDLEAKRVVEGEADFAHLLFGEALVEALDEGLGIGGFFALFGGFGEAGKSRPSGCDEADGSGSRVQEASAGGIFGGRLAVGAGIFVHR